MATLRFKNPTTGTWDLVSGGSGGGSEQIIFSERELFPAVGQTDKIYVDKKTNIMYIYLNGSYSTVGDGKGDDWDNIQG